MGHVDAEIESQPDCWVAAVDQLRDQPGALLQRNGSMAVVGCGTSWFVAQSYAALREAAGRGVTDAFPASGFPPGRRYDAVVALTRSGTTSEVIEVLQQARGRVPTLAVTATTDTPVAELADEVIALPFADERSVVQTRFATATLAMLRASLGEELHEVVQQGRDAVGAEPPAALRRAEQVTFLGSGWTVGLAHEAALKMREAAGGWTESYSAMEYRHGPISITGPGRAVWAFGPLPPGLEQEIRTTGGALETRAVDPMVELVRAQRLAVAVARDRGLDPDNPRHLTRSVILSGAAGA